MTLTRIGRVVSILAVVAGCIGVVTPVASANETVSVCDVYGDHVGGRAGGVFGISTNLACPGDVSGNTWPPGGMAIYTNSNNTIPRGTAVHWTISAPAGMTIASVYIPHMMSTGIDDGTGWGGGFFWQGGSGNVNTWDTESGWSSATTSGPSFSWPAGGSPYFGWQVVCGASSCSNGGYQYLTVELLELNVTETSGPSLNAPDGLWQTSGWIRGTWPLHFYGDSPSGLCSLSSSLNGQGGPGASVGGDGTVWHQCSSPAVDQNVNTAQYGQGVLQLTISALDSAQVPVSYSKTVDVDNQTPTISLSGPTDAPSTAGTQYVTATAGAGPSGVSGISCSVDNAPPQWYASSSAQVPAAWASTRSAASRRTERSTPQAIRRAQRSRPGTSASACPRSSALTSRSSSTRPSASTKSSGSAFAPAGSRSAGTTGSCGCTGERTSGRCTSFAVRSASFTGACACTVTGVGFASC